MKNEKRDLFAIASDIDDVLVGIERAEKAVLLVFENYHGDVNALALPSLISRFEDYEAALALSTDRIFYEREKLETLVNELYELHKNIRKAVAV